MFVGGMVGHEVENDFDARLVQFVEQAVEIVQAAEHWIDRRIIGDVVAEIQHRRGVKGREPNRINAQPREVIDATLYSLQVAFAVSIAVLK